MAELIFNIGNTYALMLWILLIVLPQNEKVRTGLTFGGVGMLALLYSAVVLTSVQELNFNDFSSLSGVKSLFASDMAVAAGWIHYLCFDFFAGYHVRKKLTESGLKIWFQLPVLFFTFMLGPFGMAIFLVVYTIRIKKATAL